MLMMCFKNTNCKEYNSNLFLKVYTERGEEKREGGRERLYVHLHMDVRFYGKPPKTVIVVIPGL